LGTIVEDQTSDFGQWNFHGKTRRELLRH